MIPDETSASWPCAEVCIVRGVSDLESAKSARAVRICFGLQNVDCWDAFLRGTWPALRVLEVDYLFEMSDRDVQEASLRAIVGAAPGIEQLYIRDIFIDLGAESDTLQVLVLERIRLALPLLRAPLLIALSARHFEDNTIASLIDGTVSPRLQELVLGDELSPRSTESLCGLLAMTPLRIPLASLHIGGSSPTTFDEASVAAASRFVRWAAAVPEVRTGNQLMDKWLSTRDKGAACIDLLERRQEILDWLCPALLALVRETTSRKRRHDSSGQEDYWELFELPRNVAKTAAHAWALFLAASWGAAMERCLTELAEVFNRLADIVVKGALWEEITRDEFLKRLHREEPLCNRMIQEDLCKIWNAHTIYTGESCGWLVETPTQWLLLRHVLPGL